jgi:hypothetical protein
MSMTTITRIGKVTDGPKPQTGPGRDAPFTIEVNGGRDFLELSPETAAQLIEALDAALKARRS